ncbi:cold-shock protein [Roseimarinus sediminis]|jgi:cold shock CspA family protein|uniref:cold-shock protein n=1 Tax=Roseimarinus sediminis TaxID=1610899 RepID=UPI003D19E5A0
MGRSQESFNKKEVRKKKEKKRKDKEKKRLARKDDVKSGGLDDMIAYVDEFGRITDTPPDPDQKEEVAIEDIEISVSKTDPSEKEDPTRKGIVTFFNDNKGFGFIRDLENRQSVFVHANNLQEEIREDNVVTFEVGKGPKGPTALNVKLFK